MIKVVLVDDHALVLHAIKALLSSAESISVIGQGGSGHEAIRLYEELKPDVIVLDLQLPGKSGIRASQQILSRDPHAKIVILTATVNEFYLSRLQKIGILGFVTKSSDSNDLIHAIRAAANGELFFCKTAVELAYTAQNENSPFHKLTKQEFDIVLQLAYGMNVEDITKALCVDKKTVYFHKNNAYEKLNITTTAELTYLAMQNGLYPRTNLKSTD